MYIQIIWLLNLEKNVVSQCAVLNYDVEYGKKLGFFFFTRFSPQLKLCGLSDSDKIANYLHGK